MMLYRWLLRVLPRELREQFGEDMVRLLRDRLQDAGSWRARVRVWAGAMADVVSVAIGERVATRAGDRPPRVRVFGDLPMEVRLAARALLRTPTYTIAAVVTLAIGIGTATALFSVVNGVLLRPLPYRDAERLAIVTSPYLTPSNVDEWQRTQRIAESTVAITISGRTAATPGGAESIRVMPVGAGFFQLLGARAVRGRLLQPQDHRPDALPVALVNEGFWTEHFEGSPLGRLLTIDERSYEIVGTLPSSFAFRYRDIAAWLPFEHADARGVNLVAKLPVGLSVDDAQAAWQRFAERFAAPAMQRDADRATSPATYVHDLYQLTLGESTRRLWILFSAAVLVLLLATANVASLSIGRALARREELAVRAALGAGRYRILRQLVIEAAVLAFWALLAGLAIAQLTPALLSLAPASLPRRAEVGIDARALLFALTAAAATVVLFGVAPALAVSRWNERTSLHAASSRGRRAGVAQSALVVIEVAAALVLTIGALLLVQTYAVLRPTQPGFQISDRVVATFDLPRGRYGDDELTLAFAEQVLAGIRALPGAPRAVLATHLPLTGNTTLRDVMPDTPGAAALEVHFRAVSAGYIDLMRMPLVAGRGIVENDRAGAAAVLVVNESAARQLWNTTAVVGRKVRIEVAGTVAELNVVGVVRDAWILRGPESRPEIFASYAQLPFNRFTVVMESTADRPVTLRALREIVNRIDRGAPIRDFATMRDMVDWTVAAPRFQATLLTLLTLIGIVLAATGCFAVLMQNVNRRTRELGVRMTLGASTGAVARLILRRALALGAAGATIGLGAALAATRVLESQLYGVERTDPATFVAAAVGVIAVVAAAALLPARRVARLDPVRALRQT